MATELNAKNFDEAIKNPLVLVDFWANWCMPCKMLGPAIEQLSEEYKGKVFVGKVDIDGNQELAEKYGIRSIPNLIIFKDGKEAGRVVGVSPKEEIAKKLDALLK